MNVRIFWVRAMKCMYAQTRPRFILSSEGVLGGLEFEPMLTPREKSPLPEMSPEEDRTRDAVDSEPKHYQLSYSGPAMMIDLADWCVTIRKISFKSPVLALSIIAGLSKLLYVSQIVSVTNQSYRLSHFQEAIHSSVFLGESPAAVIVETFYDFYYRWVWSHQMSIFVFSMDYNTRTYIDGVVGRCFLLLLFWMCLHVVMFDFVLCLLSELLSQRSPNLIVQSLLWWISGHEVK